MSNTFKTAATFTPTVDSNRDVFGATGFKISYMNKSNGTVTAVTGDLAEVLKTVDGNTAAASGLIAAGGRIIEVDDGTQFADGDTIKDANDNFHYILSITANSIEVKSPIKVDIADASTLTQVGNTGIYYINMSIPTEGSYNVIISNPTLNMQNEIVPVEIKDEVLDDVHAKLDEIKTELGLATGEIRFRAYV